jgi:hypothetical protein
MLRKLINLADLTICLDKRTASGKIEMYQVRNTSLYIYIETSIHRFRRGSEKETMDPGKQ